MATHILNGDALKDQFPSSIDGQIIIMREALVSGPIQAVTLDEMYELRAKYLLEAFGPEEEMYADRVVPEFEKILSIPKEEPVYLWFEDDLFCQMNMWFCAHLLYTSHQPKSIFLVRPQDELVYGFAAYKPLQLDDLLNTARLLSFKELELLNNMWVAVQFDDLNELDKLGESLQEDLAFINDAILARRDQQAGKPEALIREIISETGATTFGPVFVEFHRRHAIYGFGDMQVKQIYDKVVGA